VLPAIDQELKALGLRLTPQRSHILAVLKAAERPISAYDIYSQLKSTFPHISIDTVYRNLTMFTTIGVALQINLQNAASALFEYQGSGTITTRCASAAARTSAWRRVPGCLKSSIRKGNRASRSPATLSSCTDSALSARGRAPIRRGRGQTAAARTASEAAAVRHGCRTRLSGSAWRGV
jgi:Fe2+/Zn2+ uptake regulation proteins